MVIVYCYTPQSSWVSTLDTRSQCLAGALINLLAETAHKCTDIYHPEEGC